MRLGKVIFEEEKRLKTLDFTGFSASFKFRYLPLISSKIRQCITPWKPFARRRASISSKTKNSPLNSTFSQQAHHQLAPTVPYNTL